jgi:hypothetical protein
MGDLDIEPDSSLTRASIVHRSHAKQDKLSTSETEPSEKMADPDLDEEEKARRVAEEDLQGHRKQVWNNLPPQISEALLAVALISHRRQCLSDLAVDLQRVPPRLAQLSSYWSHLR